MICPKCKNPIEDNTTTCEWCGAICVLTDAVMQFDVILISSGRNKLAIVKLVKELTNLGLKEAKDLVDYAPQPIKTNVSKDEADSIKFQLEQRDATVELVKSSIQIVKSANDYVYKQIPQKKSGCFIATACYGSYDCTQVLTFRHFRDEYLSQTIAGRMFIRTYYALSPSIAKWLENKHRINTFIRKNFLDAIYDSLKKKY